MKLCRNNLHNLDDGTRQCRECRLASWRKHGAANREHIRAKARQHYAENAELWRERSRTWRKENPELARAIVRTSARKRYVPHPRTPMTPERTLERRREIKRNWQLAHPEAKRAWRAATPDLQREQGRRQNSRRRARIARVLATLTPQEWMAILDSAGHACIYCGSPDRLSIDHLTPIARGGPHTAENVAPACLPCNKSKNAQTVDEFLQIA